VILAAGEGRRLHSLSVAPDGRTIPKQFCSFCSDRSLLARTLERARRLSQPERILVVVLDDHRHWWRNELSGIPDDNIIVQPCNRGTAAGLLLPALRIMQRDRNATVVVLPSDHDVIDESALLAEFDRAVMDVHRSPEHVVVLGMTPDEADGGYGWIVPGRGETGSTLPVVRFVEKPAPALARHLMKVGAAWSSFLLVSRVEALLGLFERSLPSLLQMFFFALMRASEKEARESLNEMYRCIPTRDFSHEVLEPNARMLRLLRVPDIGWSDLGTPERLRRALWRRSLEQPLKAPDPWEGLAPRPDRRPDRCLALDTALEQTG
jgi:mannose-1-phosphate guanylyltransferase